MKLRRPTTPGEMKWFVVTGAAFAVVWLPIEVARLAFGVELVPQPVYAIVTTVFDIYCLTVFGLFIHVARVQMSILRREQARSRLTEKRALAHAARMRAKYIDES